MKKNTAVSILAIAASSAFAMADFEATFVGLTSGGRVHIDNGAFVNQSFDAGHFAFAYTNSVTDGGQRGIGQYASGTFKGFCIELQQTQSGPRTYQVKTIDQAPNPSPGAGGPAYDAADEAEVHAVIAAAIRLGWINSDLSANVVTDLQLSAIQGQIWKVVLDNSVVTGDGMVAGEMVTLQNEIANDTSARVNGLVAMLNATSQDQLFVVPLPTALFAGLMTLGGIGGVSRIRRR